MGPAEGRFKRSATRPDGIAARSRARKRVLLVGSVDLVTHFSRALGSDYHIHYAASAGEALSLTSDEGLFDLCIIDTVLPGAPGFEAARALRSHARFAETEIAFVVPTDAPLDLLDGIAASGMHSVTRPFRSEAVVRKIIELLHSRD